MDFLAFVLALGLGFGLACLIFASLLAKSNDIGNSIGQASLYSGDVVFDRREDRINRDAKETFGLGYIRPEDRKHDEPRSDLKVELERNNVTNP